MVSKCPFHNTNSIKEFDALDEDARANPWPYYDWLRDDDSRGVYKLPQEDSFYLVHRYNDVKNILTDTVNFSSHVLPTVKSPFFALMDGDEHRRIRNVVASIFTPKNLHKWNQPLHNIILECTNQLAGSKQPELFKLWADAIPLSTLSLLFGLEGSNNSIAKLHRDAIAINRALFVTGGTGPRRKQTPELKEKFNITMALLQNTGKIYRLRKIIGARGMRELLTMIKPVNGDVAFPRPDFKSIPLAIAPMLDIMLTFATKLKSVKNNNSDEPISIFKEAVDAGNVSFMEMVMAGTFILFAGYETTASLLSNSFVHLAKNPQTFQELKANPEKIENFMEESLRYYTPVGRFLRKTVNDVQIGGTVIPKNAIVLLMLGAANTDPEKFHEGCSFNSSRPNLQSHLSFGKGVHFCVGAPLARLQVMMALTELIAKFDSISIDESQPLKMVVDRDNGILRYEQVFVNVR